MTWRYRVHEVVEGAPGRSRTVDVTALHDGSLRVTDGGRSVVVRLSSEAAPPVSGELSPDASAELFGGGPVAPPLRTGAETTRTVTVLLDCFPDAVVFESHANKGTDEYWITRCYAPGVGLIKETVQRGGCLGGTKEIVWELDELVP